MGKGDKRTFKGKLFKGSFGNSRTQKGVIYRPNSKSTNTSIRKLPENMIYNIIDKIRNEIKKLETEIKQLKQEQENYISNNRENSDGRGAHGEAQTFNVPDSIAINAIENKKNNLNLFLLEKDRLNHLKVYTLKNNESKYILPVYIYEALKTVNEKFVVKNCILTDKTYNEIKDKICEEINLLNLLNFINK